MENEEEEALVTEYNKAIEDIVTINMTLAKLERQRTVLRERARELVFECRECNITV